MAVGCRAQADGMSETCLFASYLIFCCYSSVCSPFVAPHPRSLLLLLLRWWLLVHSLALCLCPNRNGLVPPDCIHVHCLCHKYEDVFYSHWWPGCCDNVSI